METARFKISTKNNSVYRSYQSQLMGWMHTLVFAQFSHRYIDLRQQRPKDIFNIFRKGSALDLIIINFGEWLDQKWLGIHFVLIQISQTLFWKF